MTQPQGSSPYEPQSEPSQGSAPQQPSYGQPSYGSPEQPSAYGAPQQPYGQPQQPYGAAQPYQQPYGYQQTVEHPQAQTVFILGIVGIFVGIIPFIAWYLGAQAKKEIEAGAP